MDIVIPFLYSKRTDGLELRFCLRSIEKHLNGFRDIWIIGETPLWLQGCKSFIVKDSPYERLKENNIYRKIISACENDEISDNFLFMNDDHYFLKNYTVSDFPYYHRGELIDSMRKNKGNYRGTLNHSRTVLFELGLPTLDFDCHFPIVYNKEKFVSAFEGLKWKDYGYAIKSVYCGKNGINGELIQDCKINSNRLRDMILLTKDRDWFSTGTMNTNMEIFLAGNYPRKSKYEK